MSGSRILNRVFPSVMLLLLLLVSAGGLLETVQGAPRAVLGELFTRDG
jgi:hypothetical protein